MEKKLHSTKRGEQLLKQLHKCGPFLAASLVVGKKRCGRKDCRCATEGPIHPTANVTWKEKGKTRTLHVPQKLVKEVAQWIEEWKSVRELLQQISEEQRRRLQELKKNLKD